jgi:hypothetical protein
MGSDTHGGFCLFFLSFSFNESSCVQLKFETKFISENVAYNIYFCFICLGKLGLETKHFSIINDTGDINTLESINRHSVLVSYDSWCARTVYLIRNRNN